MAKRKQIATERAPSPEKPIESCYDRLVVEVATLECALATLAEWDLSGRPTDQTCRIASAELVLRQSIEALRDISGDVCGEPSPTRSGWGAP